MSASRPDFTAPATDKKDVGPAVAKRPYRSFRVKFSDTNVATSVGHACLFGDKRWAMGEAYRDASGSISFAALYGLVMDVAYGLRHVGIKIGDMAYLDAGEGRDGLVGLLGALRAGCTVVAPGRELPVEECKRFIDEAQCRAVLTVRPQSFAQAGDTEIFDLARAAFLTLPKELDWQLPRPLPDQVAILVPDKPDATGKTGEIGSWRGLRNNALTSYLRGDRELPHSSGIIDFPFRDALVRLVGSKSHSDVSNGNRAPDGNSTGQP